MKPVPTSSHFQSAHSNLTGSELDGRAGLALAAPVYSGHSDVVGFAAVEVSEVTPKRTVGAADGGVAIWPGRRGHEHLGPTDLCPSDSAVLTARGGLRYCGSTES